jgi:hypothetical protein
VQDGRREILRELRSADGPGRPALHRMRNRTTRRRTFLRRLRHPGSHLILPSADAP